MMLRCEQTMLVTPLGFMMVHGCCPAGWKLLEAGALKVHVAVQSREQKRLQPPLSALFPFVHLPTRQNKIDS